MPDSSYTPDLQFVRQLYVRNAITPVSSGHPDVVLTERGEQFDRLMSEMKAAALKELAEDLTHLVDAIQEKNPNPLDWQTGALAMRDQVRQRAETVNHPALTDGA